MTARRGFTVVELVVVMVIMAILLTLGVASFNGSQSKAWNADRKAEIETIAKGLESRYVKGNPFANAAYITKGTYPSVNEIRHMEGIAIAGITPTGLGVYIDQGLPGTTLETFFPPNVTVAAGSIATAFKVICTTACGAAEVSATRDAAINNSSSVYVYEPITANNQVCINTACVRYNLYYRTEGASPTILTESSKHQ